MIIHKSLSMMETFVKKSIAPLMLILSFCLMNPVHAEQFVSPDWNSDRVLEERAQGEDDAIVIAFHSRTVTSKGAAIVKSGTARLWSDIDQISIDNNEIITDYRLCRVFSWNRSETTFSNQSCHAGPAFRKIELRNRLQINRLLTEVGVSDGNVATFEEPFWIEQEFRTQNTASNPLTLEKTKDSSEWRLGKKTVTKTSKPGLIFSKNDRRRFARYFSRYVNIHPQVRRAILDSGEIPSQIVILRRNLEGESTETISFSSMERAKIEFPLPPNLTSNTVVRSRGDTIEAQGLRQTLQALAGTAQPTKGSFEELLRKLEDAAKQKKPLETTLIFLKITQLYGGALITEQNKMNQLRSILPSVQPLLGLNEAAKLMEASDLAGSKGAEPAREASALYLSGAENLDQIDFGTFRYVTFANLVRISQDTKKWDKAIFEKMPSLTDNYWKHIAAYPWASNAFKDLGDTWYSQFEAFRAWEAWDLGRAVDPDWQLSSMKSVAEFEKRIRTAMPESF